MALLLPAAAETKTAWIFLIAEVSDRKPGARELAMGVWGIRGKWCAGVETGNSHPVVIKCSPDCRSPPPLCKGPVQGLLYT